MKRRVTIEDIAAEVGVSRQTVTRAMNGMPRISPQTRERVLEASRRLGYQPSRFAKNLASNTKTRAIGSWSSRSATPTTASSPRNC